MKVVTVKKDCKTTIHKNLTSACNSYGWSRWTLYKKEWPITWDGYVLSKEEVE